MTSFDYVARRSPMEDLSGTLSAEDEQDAARRLLDMGYYPIRIIVRERGDEGWWERKISGKSVALFTWQLSTLLDSGIPLADALNVLREQIDNARLAGVVGELRSSVAEGNSLADAMSKHPKLFPEAYCSMVRAGEAGGSLSDVLGRLGEYLTKQEELKTRLWSALAYPLLLLALGVVTVALLVTYVLPKFTILFEDMGQDLPFITRTMIHVSEFSAEHWWLVLVGALLAALVCSRVHRTALGRSVMDRFTLSLPIVGPVVQKAGIAQVCRTLSTLLSNGVPVLQALSITQATARNTVLAEAMDEAGESAARGAMLSHALASIGRLAPMVTSVVAVGEESGRVEKMLFDAADTYDKEVDMRINLLMSLIPPLILLGLGVVVGCIVAAILLPIFDLSTFVR